MTLLDSQYIEENLEKNSKEKSKTLNRAVLKVFSGGECIYRSFFSLFSLELFSLLYESSRYNTFPNRLKLEQSWSSYYQNCLYYICLSKFTILSWYYHGKIITSENVVFGSQFKACVCYFSSIFIFTLNDSPLKTIKNAFYFI